MSLDSQALKNVIAKADPLDAVMRIRSGGKCGNEAIFRICLLLKSESMSRDDATPLLRKWFDYWKADSKTDKNEYWQNLCFEDVEVHADEIWSKIKYESQNQLEVAIARAEERLERGESFPRLGDYGGVPVRLLTLVCYELSRISEVWFLAERTVAEILGHERNDAGRNRAVTVLKVLMRKNFIEKVKPGNAHWATRYRLVCGTHTLAPPERAEDVRESR